MPDDVEAHGREELAERFLRPWLLQRLEELPNARTRPQGQESQHGHWGWFSLSIGSWCLPL